MTSIGRLPLFSGALVGATLGGGFSLLFALPAARDWNSGLVLAVIWGAIVGVVGAKVLRRLEAKGVGWGMELARWSLIAVTAGFVAWPFRGAGMVGAGDANWYTLVLADYVAQLRAGVFPVWVGQSEYGFNGSVYPLRVAPYFQHAAGVVDLLTGRTLFWTEIKNLVLVLHFFLAGATGYLLFNQPSLGRRRGFAAGLTVLWLLSPGVLAPIYGGDQYMTFVALPYLPLLLLGWWRWAANQIYGRRLIGGALGVLLWCHTPLALLSLGASVVFFAVMFLRRRTFLSDLKSAVGVTGLVIGLGAYPILSYMAVDNRTPASAKAESVLIEVTRAWPGYFLPHRSGDTTAEAYQFGFALLALTAAVSWLVIRRGNSAERTTAALIMGLIVCIAPVPGVTSRIWNSVPPSLIGVMNIWPQQRFIPLCTVLGFGLVSAALVRATPSGRTGLAVLVLVGGLWSGHQAHLFRARFETTHILAERARASLDANHVVLTRYSFNSFATPNPYFSHGYMDPRLEQRLLDPQTGRVIASNLEAAAPTVLAGEHPRRVSHGRLTPLVMQNQGRAIEFEPSFTLKAGRAYALRWEPEQPIEGTLILYGRNYDTAYQLPYSGDGALHPMGFGSAETTSPILSRRVSPEADETLTLSFFSREALQSLFIRYALFEVDPESLPIRVESLIPLRGRTSADLPVIWETPRMWQTGWQASVNGQPVAVVRTAQNLVGVPLPPGSNQIELTYAPPLWLRLHYGATLLTALVGFGWLLFQGRRWLKDVPADHPQS